MAVNDLKEKKWNAPKDKQGGKKQQDYNFVKHITKVRIFEADSSISLDNKEFKSLQLACITMQNF